MLESASHSHLHVNSPSLPFTLNNRARARRHARFLYQYRAQRPETNIAWRGRRISAKSFDVFSGREIDVVRGGSLLLLRSAAPSTVSLAVLAGLSIAPPAYAGLDPRLAELLR